MIHYISINKDQWLSDVLKEIPTNTIFNKTLTGCGATTLEINAARNSIIIEPNVPVIIGKKVRHPQILAVFEGITKDDIKAYLAGEYDGYRKIITTPEGFAKKVMPAMRETDTNVYNDYFLLFDECEKTIQDIGYRGDIYLPIEDFFEFKGKAMVSATPIMPSDPRFRKFDMIRLTPTYAYKKRLQVCVTNNTVRVLRRVIELCEEHNKKACIFFNSTDATLKIIQTLKLVGKSKVFCSEKSMRKLKKEGYKEVSDKLTDLADVNFFTSRFYSAVDISINEKPVVIVLTDVYNAPHSTIDPSTEVYQAVGRFRNGVHRIYHITNWNVYITSRPRDAVFHELNSLELAYRSVEDVMHRADPIGKAAIQKSLNEMEYSRFLTTSGTRNYQMWDNAWEDEKIKGYYKNEASIRDAYKDAPFVAKFRVSILPVSDEDRLRFSKERLSSTKELWQGATKLLDEVDNANFDKEAAYIIDELGEEFKLMIEAHKILGSKRIAELDYDRRKIEAAIGNIQENRLLTSEAMQSIVYARYNTGDEVAVSDMNQFIGQIILQHGIPYKHRVDRRLIQLFFEVEDKRTSAARYYVLGKKKFEF